VRSAIPLAASATRLRACWRWLGLAANLALLLIMFGVSLDAILRYLLNRPIAGMLEGIELLLVFSVFLSLAGTQGAKGHIAVDIVLERLQGRMRRALEAFIAALGALLFAAVTWATAGMAVRSVQMREYSAGLIAFPIYPAKILVALGCLLLTVQLCHEFACAIAALAERSEAPATRPQQARNEET